MKGSVLGLAAESLREQGRDVTDKYPVEIAAEAMATSDFQNLLADGQNKKVMAGYDGNFGNWREIALVDFVNNFRDFKSVRVTEFGDLKQLAEYEEYPFAGVGDTGMSAVVHKYGIRFGVSAELIANDDTREITRLPMKIGSTVGRTIGKFVFGLLTGSAATYDGVAVFHADHNNLMTKALSSAGLTEAITKLARQTAQVGDPDDSDTEPIDIVPAKLVVPPDLKQTAKELLSATTLIELSGGVIETVKDNVLASEGIQLVTSSLISETTEWYLLADPNLHPIIEINFVRGWGAGQGDEPKVMKRKPEYEGDEYDAVDSLGYKVKIAYGGLNPDYRGGVKSDGTT